MQFSGADFIVIAIVLIVLVVYRQLDRNNRSLEKVKKYASRVHDELEAHVQEKVTSIKDMGIEVEVHQKAAREVLKRVQAIESGLGKRSDEIEHIGQRIEEYDKALGELVTMTARAEENISRVRDESSYVDGVGKRIKESQARLTSVEQTIDSIVDRFADVNRDQLVEVQSEAFEDAEKRAQGLREELMAFQERVNQFSEYVRGVEERGAAVSERTRAELEDISETIINRAQEASIQGSEQISELREQLELLESDYQKKLLALAERGERMETAALAKLREQIDEQGQAVQEQLTERLESNKRALLERVAALESSIKESQSQLAERTSRLDEERATVERRIAEFGGELTHSIERAADQIQRDVLGGIESRLSEYESQITYRFEKLEGVGGDLEDLEGRLHDAMNQATGRVQQEFAEFSREFARSRDAQTAEVEQEMVRVRGQMSELETGIVDLKNQAYANVSEKLQVFEDEFFADLKERQVGMEQHLVDWQAAFQQELESVTAQAREERAELETGYSENVKRRLEELRAASYGRFEKLQEEMLAFQQGIEARVGSAQELIDSLERDLNEETSRLAADAKSSLREQFARHRDQVGEEVVELERGLRQRIEGLGESFESGRQELESMLEKTRSDASVWKAQVDQRLQTTSNDVNQQIADFRVTIGETIAEVRQTFSEDREAMLAASAEERSRMEEELVRLASQVDNLAGGIREKSAEALAEFSEQYEALKQETERSTKALGDGVDDRIEHFRTLVQDTRDQFQAMQERLLGKLEEQAGLLTVNLDEIEKRQRSFVEQTKIFERADSMKEELQRAVGALREDLSRVEQQRRDIRDLEAQFAKIRKNADEVSERMAKFMAEKRRIDGLEGDYRKLMTMSQAVEVKLQNVTASNDTLQSVQASLRSLEELERDVEGRFQRLEKKRSILDLTTEGVDKNFQSLQEVESRLSEISSELNALPGKVEELSGRMAQLAANKRDADAAVKQLALLDQTMEEIEERMENLNSAREWLARTETRLSEVQSEAEEQVKLLGAIMKQQSKGSGDQDGAPPVTTRDTVLKLARQSWNVDEIARATSLSRGEVELILELATK
jgi:chromosome segregation ATPase